MTKNLNRITRQYRRRKDFHSPAGRGTHTSSRAHWKFTVLYIPLQGVYVDGLLSYVNLTPSLPVWYLMLRSYLPKSSCPASPASLRNQLTWWSLQIDGCSNFSSWRTMNSCTNALLLWVSSNQYTNRATTAGKIHRPINVSGGPSATTSFFKRPN